MELVSEMIKQQEERKPKNSPFTSFKGADIVATFDGKVIGEFQSISSSIRSSEPSGIGPRLGGYGGELSFSGSAEVNMDALRRLMGADNNGTNR